MSDRGTVRRASVGIAADARSNDEGGTCAWDVIVESSLPPEEA